MIPRERLTGQNRGGGGEDKIAFFSTPLPVAPPPPSSLSLFNCFHDHDGGRDQCTSGSRFRYKTAAQQASLQAELSYPSLEQPSSVIILDSATLKALIIIILDEKCSVASFGKTHSLVSKINIIKGK